MKLDMWNFHWRKKCRICMKYSTGVMYWHCTYRPDSWDSKDKARIYPMQRMRNILWDRSTSTSSATYTVYLMKRYMWCNFKDRDRRRYCMQYCTTCTRGSHHQDNMWLNYQDLCNFWARKQHREGMFHWHKRHTPVQYPRDNWDNWIRISCAPCLSWNMELNRRTRMSLDSTRDYSDRRCR